MADSICRTLRDGGLEGEHAPALTIKDRISSPLGLDVFNHVLAQLSSFILAGKSQSRGLVLVALTRSPSFYLELLKSGGVQLNSAQKWIHILDCYSDPLGWKDNPSRHEKANTATDENPGTVALFRDVKDANKLFCSVSELGKELLGPIKGRFSVAIDSVSEMLRHASLTSVASFISKLRSHDQVSSIFWLLHSDLHEAKIAAVFDYISSMIASLEPMIHPSNGERLSSENRSLRNENLSRGNFSVRFKRRNGRVRQMCEEISVEQSGIKFTPVSSDGQAIGGGPLPKVQFNLELSEKEQMDRASVVLPFEHQGNGKPIQIYDGRRSLADTRTNTVHVPTEASEAADPRKGEIIYLRDSDDERPDSDEDPDDDLDI
ncbi:elongator complex protein 5 [Punica granatum]|uniref:Elongator complex protein 5 n=1 Tax=Punica granatum TaxID=22663 RepID=A0A218VWR1_PUNGR|nr:elongator complex protein 5 [Punica granatum]OWM64431.1 hypothetical protein CDL15_Pgr020398 [Punica granatum]